MEIQDLNMAPAGPEEASADTNILKQVDIRWTVDGHRLYYCLLQVCADTGTFLPSWDAWKRHRNTFHQIPEKEDCKIPTESAMLKLFADEKAGKTGSSSACPADPTNEPQVGNHQQAGNAAASVGSGVDRQTSNQLAVRGPVGNPLCLCILNTNGEQKLCFEHLEGCQTHQQSNHDLHRPPTVPAGGSDPAGVPMHQLHLLETGNSIPHPLQIAPANPMISAGLPTAGLRPASLESNIYFQFDFQRPFYFCLLSPCFERGARFSTNHIWKIHRNRFHGASLQSPTGWDVRRWIADGKSRPYLFAPRASTRKPRLAAPGPRWAAQQPASMERDGRQPSHNLLPPWTASWGIQVWQDHRNHFHAHGPYIPNGNPHPWTVRFTPTGSQPFMPTGIQPFMPTGFQPHTQVPAPRMQEEIFNNIGHMPDSANARARNIFGQFHLEVAGGEYPPQVYRCQIRGCMKTWNFLPNRQNLERHYNEAHLRFY